MTISMCHHTCAIQTKLYMASISFSDHTFGPVCSVLELCAQCAGAMCTVYWSCVYSELVLCVQSIGAVCAVCWSCVYSVCVYSVLELCVQCARAVCTACWCCAYSVLKLCVHCAVYLICVYCTMCTVKCTGALHRIIMTRQTNNKTKTKQTVSSQILNPL